MGIEIPESSFLSVGRARKIAPSGFDEAYDWLINHVDGPLFERPTKKSGVAPDLELSLAAGRRGIHKPAKRDYALTVTLMGKGLYDDRIMENGDGTWVVYYRAQKKNEGSVTTTDLYNEALRKSMRDGLPVGVLERVDGSHYRSRGLAFVVSHEDGLFTLFGPVSDGPEDGILSFSAGELSKEEEDVIASFDEEDERVYRAVTKAQRTSQKKFRDGLMRAYKSKCAISGCDVTSALQAAHISSYLGPKSQVVSNGLLLRADLHLLYDAHLLSVDPDCMEVCLAPELKESSYVLIDHSQITVPDSVSDRPSERRLAAHLSRFKLKNYV